MKIHVTFFTICTAVVGGIPLIVLFIWCAANGFGSDIVRLFESVHPNGGLSILEQYERGFVAAIPGIAVNSLYALLDAIIVGFVFSSLYNILVGRFSDPGKKK